MSNMGYARFRNTLRDLQDCEQRMEGDVGSEEEKARDQLIDLCVEISLNYGHIVNRVIEEM